MTPEPEAPGLLEHLRRAFHHGAEAFRSYVALLLTDAERRYTRILHRSILMLGLVGMGIVGIAILATGVVRLLDGYITIPGGGAIIVGCGLILLAGSLGLLAVLSDRERK